jgi:hypothetical protein
LLYALGLRGDFPENFLILAQPAFPPMVEFLLRYGEDPNKAIDSHTVWEYYLKAYMTNRAPTFNRDEHYREWALILGSMLQYGAKIANRHDNYDPAEKNPPNLFPWEFKTFQVIGKPGLRHDFVLRPLETLINDLATKAPPDAAALLRHSYLQRKQPPPPRSSPAGSSTPRKRSWDSFKETRTPDSAVCIELFSDDDERIEFKSKPPREMEGSRIRGTSPTKQPAFLA